MVFLGNGLVFVQGGKNIKFIDGKYSTEDKREIERLKDYPTDPPNAMEGNNSIPFNAEWHERELKDYTIKELKIYADENDIDLKDAKKKVDILEIVGG